MSKENSKLGVINHIKCIVHAHEQNLTDVTDIVMS